MNFNQPDRRSVVAAIASAMLIGCGSARQKTGKNGQTEVILIGAIHQGHVTSEKFSLKVLERAIRKARPDQIFVEIPPDRLPEAIRGFEETGRVTEPRAAVFPEYRDMLFPLTRELEFEMVPVAGWTRQMADNRSAALARLSKDPKRAEEWKAHRAAQAAFSAAVKGRRDDPRFIHSDGYDALVEKAQTPYQRYFDKDLGPGGWTQINAAHYALIDAALNRVSDQGKRVMIIFGAFHKYVFKRELEKRADIELLDPLPLLVG